MRTKRKVAYKILFAYLHLLDDETNFHPRTKISHRAHQKREAVGWMAILATEAYLPLTHRSMAVTEQRRFLVSTFPYAQQQTRAS
jgi:hypothetical protein